MAHGRHTVTDIVAAVYCEQKVVFDHRFGKKVTPSVARAARRGSAEHARFEREGLLLAPERVLARAVMPRTAHMRQGDRRCYIATRVYGADAVETQTLRQWRDSALLPHWPGRLLISIYYRLSPWVARLLPPGTARARVAKRILDQIVRSIGDAT